jgi:putative membrane protein
VDLFLTAKAFHVVGFISWFAGLFYLVRLFVYHAEANERSPDERRILHAQLVVMQARVWSIIATPAMLVTLVAGATMLHATRALPMWLVIKLGFVGALAAYHVACGVLRRAQARGESKIGSARLRLWNELATLLMFAIVFLAVFKQGIGLVFGLVGMVVLGIVLFGAATIYRRRLADTNTRTSAPVSSETRSSAD